MLFRKKFLVLFVLFGYITMHNSLSSGWLTKELQKAQKAVKEQISAPQVQQQGYIVTVPEPGVFPAAPAVQQPVNQQTPAPQVQQQGYIVTVPQPGVFPAAPAPQQPVQQKTPAPVKQVQQNTNTTSRLFNLNFGAGGVLPTFVKNGKKYLILSREAGGNDKGTYDDFGGKRDPIGSNKKETPPLITAAREFFEEAILILSIGISLQETQNFIHEDNSYTEFVIVKGQNVTYITDFTVYADKFFANFYHAYKTTTNSHSREKNSIAIVGWDELKKVVSNTSSDEGVMIDAEVLNPKDLKWYKEKITLRPFFVKKFRPFWMDKPYKKDINSKVRFY